MVYCCVFGCSNRSKRNCKISFYKIPTVLEDKGSKFALFCKRRRDLWLSRINRVEPTEKCLQHWKVCSLHFISGKPADLHSEFDPDWAPSLKMGYENSKRPVSPQEDDESVHSSDSEENDIEENIKIELSEEVETDRASPVGDTVMPTIVSFGRQQPTLSTVQFRHNQFLPNESSCISIDSVETVSAGQTVTSSTDNYLSRGVQTDEGLFEALLPEIIKLQNEKDILTEKLVRYEILFPDISDLKNMEPLIGLNTRNLGRVSSALHLDFVLKQDLFMLLLKLRNGLSDELLSYIYKIPVSGIAKKLGTVTDILYAKIVDVIENTKAKNKYNSLPSIFKEYFPKCRFIVDALEFRITASDDPIEERVMYSKSLNCCSVKCLLGFTPSGSVVFVSDMYAGSTTDEELFLQSGILDSLAQDDAITLDMKLTMDKAIESVGVPLYPAEYLTDKLKFYIIEQTNDVAVQKCIITPRTASQFSKFKFFNEPINSLSLHSVHKLVAITAYIITYGNR